MNYVEQIQTGFKEAATQSIIDTLNSKAMSSLSQLKQDSISETNVESVDTVEELDKD